MESICNAQSTEDGDMVRVFRQAKKERGRKTSTFPHLWKGQEILS